MRLPPKHNLIILAFGLLLLAAVAALLFSLPLPLPLRLAALATDLIAALILLVAWRQTRPPK